MPEQLTYNRLHKVEESASVSDTHQMPFLVLPTLESDNILTLPNGKLIRGLRNAVTSNERNAIAIAGRHGIGAKARGSIILPSDQDIRAYGFVVEPAWRTVVPEYADFTQSPPNIPHNHSLELHSPKALLEQLEIQAEQEPDRQIDLAVVRAFGTFVLNHR